LFLYFYRQFLPGYFQPRLPALADGMQQDCCAHSLFRLESQASGFQPAWLNAEC
jgi:hypothetical protein